MMEFEAEDIPKVDNLDQQTPKKTPHHLMPCNLLHLILLVILFFYCESRDNEYKDNEFFFF